MKVLHISNWFPTKNTPHSAVWIRRLINSLPKNVHNTIIHFEIKNENKIGIRSEKGVNLKSTILLLPLQRWLIIEWVYFLWLWYQFVIRKIHKGYDVINFHIAYPMLSYWHVLKKYINKPVVISEHWSAYHFNFGVEKKLPRIQRIFQQNIPVIAVSYALIGDIKKFAKKDFPSFVVPNVVNSNIFYSDPNIKRENFFFMVSQWKEPKDPISAMEAFLSFQNNNKDFRLIIGGYGPQLVSMQDWIYKNNAGDFIKMIGKLTEQEVANYLRKCTAFLHPSDYETFSVVCAEAVSCGTPVVALKVGGIPEVVTSNGILLESKEEWDLAMEKVIDLKITGQNKSFDSLTVGFKYAEVLQEVINDFKK